MLEMAGGRVGGVGVEEVLELGDQGLEAAVVVVGGESAGLEGGEIVGEEVNDAADGFGAGNDMGEIAGDPVGGDEGVGVGGEDGGGGVWEGGLREGFEAGASVVHEQPAGGADVSFGGGEGLLGEKEVEGGVGALVVLGDGVGAVGAVVEEQEDFVGGVGKRVAGEVALEAERVEGGGERGFFVAGRDDDGGDAVGVRGRGEQRGDGCGGKQKAHAGKGSASGSRWRVESFSVEATASQASLAQRRSAPW